MRLLKLFLVLFLDALVGVLPLAIVVVGALVGAGFSAITGGNFKMGALLMGGLAFMVVVVLSIRSALGILQNFRGTGAYLYQTKWGSYLQN